MQTRKFTKSVGSQHTDQDGLATSYKTGTRSDRCKKLDLPAESTSSGLPIQYSKKMLFPQYSSCIADGLREDVHRRSCHAKLYVIVPISCSKELFEGIFVLHRLYLVSRRKDHFPWSQSTTCCATNLCMSRRLRNPWGRSSRANWFYSIVEENIKCEHYTSEPRLSSAISLKTFKWQTKRVFYMTPQTFRNDVSRGSVDPLDIILIVFGTGVDLLVAIPTYNSVDEAHRATGDYAYAQIVRYMMAKNPHIRILALTATPGNKPETVQSIVDALHIDHIEIRNEESLDLREYMHKKVCYSGRSIPSAKPIMYAGRTNAYDSNERRYHQDPEFNVQAHGGK